MVDTHSVSPDGLQWRFTLRPGLRFHDDTPVTAADCVASLARWAPRDALGRMLLAAGASLSAQDERQFTIALQRPFPLMLNVLGKPNAPLPVIMPSRVVAAAGDGRIKDIIGSGPFRFAAERWRAGDSMILAKFRRLRAAPRARGLPLGAARRSMCPRSCCGSSATTPPAPTP